MATLSRSILAAAAVLGLCGCGASLAKLKDLAAAGEVNRAAPVLTHVEVRIAAPPSRVWALLVDAGRWPLWQKAITGVSPATPLSNQARFDWRTGGSTIHSQVQLYDPERRLAWTGTALTGTALTAKAAHVWRLSLEPDGSTRVTVDESMDGPLMRQLYSSQDLTESATEWLASLKQAAEHAP